MLKHKSYILNCDKEHDAKIPLKPSGHSVVSSPKMAAKETIVAHYDDHTPISLSLPQSLSLTQEFDDNMNTYSQHRNHSLSLDIDDDFYSDANAYFKADQDSSSLADQDNHSFNRFTKSKSVDVLGETTNETTPVDDISKNDQKVIVNNNEDSEVVEAIVVPNGKKIVEQDRKFEEDLKVIMEGKKIFDKERVKKDPAEAIKEKNHGMMEKSDDDKKLEDKLKNDHAIFDKIAQSMEMANSYDLGNIAMDKKFDSLEEETDTNFSKKIHDFLDGNKKNEAGKDENNDEDQFIDDAVEMKKKGRINDIEDEAARVVDKEKEAPSYIKKEDDDKVLTKDFLKDLDKLDKLDKLESESTNTTEDEKLSTQSSFTSTISIKHRHLKSRVFAVSGSTVEVMINSHWNPINCSKLTELNVTLTKSIDYWPDSEQNTKKFRIGGPDTKIWNNLESGNYYLTFYFVNNTNPNCELSGSIEVKT